MITDCVKFLVFQVVHILNMTTAQVHSFQLTADESLHSLQKRIEAETKIEVVTQELLQETGVSLDPRKPAAQCVLDGVVSPLFSRSHETFGHTVFLTDFSLHFCDFHHNLRLRYSCLRNLSMFVMITSLFSFYIVYKLGKRVFPHPITQIHVRNI